MVRIFSNKISYDTQLYKCRYTVYHIHGSYGLRVQVYGSVHLEDHHGHGGYGLERQNLVFHLSIF